MHPDVSVMKNTRDRIKGFKVLHSCGLDKLKFRKACRDLMPL